MSLSVAGDQAISNFLEGYELVVDLWKYMNRRDELISCESRNSAYCECAVSSSFFCVVAACYNCLGDKSPFALF